jgi:hypothetical protein
MLQTAAKYLRLRPQGLKLQGIADLFLKVASATWMKGVEETISTASEGDYAFVGKSIDGDSLRYGHS